DLGGRLLALGWMELLWRMRRPTVRNSRLLLLGVRRHLHGTGVAPVAALLLLEEGLRLARRYGLKTAELGWIVETNRPMLALVERAVAARRKVYRVFEKSL